MPRFVALAAAATLAAGLSGALVPSAGAASPAATSTPGAYVPVATSRLLAAKSVAAHSHATVSPGVPSGASAVAVSVSLTAGSASGVLTASAGNLTSTPKVATVSFVAKQSVGDLAVVPLDGGTSVKFWNNSGSRVSLTVDLSGYYVGGTPTAGGAYVPESGGAVRVADTRYGTDGNRKGALHTKATMAARIGGLAGVPRSAASAAVTVTVIDAKASGRVNVRTSGGSNVPGTIQVQAGRQVSQLVLVPLSGSGEIAVSNGTAKNVQIAIDVSGYYVGAAADTASMTQSVESSTVASQPVGASASKRIVVAGHGGVPLTGAVAAVVTLRVVKAATFGAVSAASGSAPTVVQFSTGSTRSGVVIAALDSSGAITVHNSAKKKVSVQVDVDGYVTGTSVPAASVPSVAHYLTRLHGKSQSADEAAMRAYADADTARSQIPQLVLLDIGAQSVHGPKLSAKTPGVALANTSPTVRLTYAQLEADVAAYAAEFAKTSGGVHVRIAVGTNNDGDFDRTSKTYYAPTARGRAWATKVITPLRKAVPGGVTVLAADDIEYGFSSTEPQARTWENSYLAALPHGQSGGTQLLYNGDANSCPRTPGTTGQTCTSGWTQADYYALAYNGGHVQVLPQVFYPSQAAQWANVDRTGNGSSSRGDLSFAGALTDHSRDGSHLAATDAHAALYRALSADHSAPRVPAATDFS